MNTHKKRMILSRLILITGVVLSEPIWGSEEAPIPPMSQNSDKRNQYSSMSNQAHQQNASQATQSNLNTLAQTIKDLEHRFEDELAPREDELKIWRGIADTGNAAAKVNYIASIVFAIASIIITFFSVMYFFLIRQIFKYKILQKNFDSWRKLQTLLAKIRSTIVNNGLKPMAPAEPNEANAPGPTDDPIQAYIIAENICNLLLQLVPDIPDDTGFSRIKKILGHKLPADKRQIASQGVLNQIVQLADHDHSPAKKLIIRYLTYLANSGLVASKEQKLSIEKFVDEMI